MALIIPQNEIFLNYTGGGEFVISNTGADYQGYYYELNGSFYTGEKGSDSFKSLLLVKKKPNEDINLATYNFLQKDLPTQLKVKSLPFIYNGNKYDGTPTMRYFIKKINDNLIKEVSKNDFQKAQVNPLYQTVEVEFSYDMSSNYFSYINKQMPGIEDFIMDDFNNNPTSGFEPDIPPPSGSSSREIFSIL